MTNFRQVHRRCSLRSCAHGFAGFAADSVFDRETNGFGFQNYANDPASRNLTPAEMVRLCGPVVNSRGEGGEITLEPAREWMSRSNRS